MLGFTFTLLTYAQCTHEKQPLQQATGGLMQNALKNTSCVSNARMNSMQNFKPNNDNHKSTIVVVDNAKHKKIE